METLQAILTRRSIRAFRSDPVPEETIRILLEAAMFAPSARNTRAWTFVTIRKREKLDRLAQIHPYAGMLKSAPLAIAVCGDREREPHDGYLAINCAAAVQNLMLAAHDQDLGTCWLGVYPRAERMTDIARELVLPSTIIPIALVAVGWPDELKPTPTRYEHDRVFEEAYNRQGD